MNSRQLALAALSIALAVCSVSLVTAEPLRTGDFKDEYRDPKSGDLIMRYRMVVPDELPESPTLGLIVAFHGLNGNEDHMTGFARDSASRVGIADEYVIMGGKSIGDGWAESDDDKVLAWIEWAKSTYPIDPRRVHLIGMSNGGGMVKRFGWKHQHLFASVSSYCGAGSGFSGSPRVPAKKSRSRRRGAGPGENRTEWYFVHGDADTQVGVESSRQCVKQLLAKGYRCIYREIDGADHGGVLRNREVAAENLRFIHALRNKEIELSRDARRALLTAQKELRKDSADAAIAKIDELVRVGGPVSAPALRSALRNSDPKVKLAAIEAAGRVLYGREVVPDIVNLTRGKSDEVSTAAFKCLGVLANWGFADAREYLIRAARGRSLAIESRAAAVEGLARSAKLMFLGWYGDPEVVWTLVLLLDDREERLRGAAFTALREGVGESFDYSADLAPRERREAASRWAKWCEQNVGKPPRR